MQMSLSKRGISGPSLPGRRNHAGILQRSAIVAPDLRVVGNVGRVAALEIEAHEIRGNVSAVRSRGKIFDLSRAKRSGELRSPGSQITLGELSGRQFFELQEIAGGR